MKTFLKTTFFPDRFQLQSFSYFSFLISFSIFLFLCRPGFAQKNDGLIIEKINGVKYYIHPVEKGNTLYSVSKKYGVTIEEITKNNPEAASGLRIGQQLKIPVSKANISENTAIPEIQNDHLIHVVAEKETLYSISKKYNIRVKDIMETNPETASKELSIGQKLRIPLLKNEQVMPVDILPAGKDSTIVSAAPTGKITQDSASRAAIVLENKYDIAFLLPFYTDINDSIERNLRFNEKIYIDKESEMALLFYEGALLALDSLKKLGISLKSYAYDTGADSLKLAGALAKPGVKDMDLLIGPLYQYLFKDAAAFAKKHGAGIVCPVPQSAKILLENKYASKVFASPLVQSMEMAGYMVNKYGGKKIIVFGSSEKNDIRLCESFIEKAEAVAEKNKNGATAISSFYFAEVISEKIKALLSTSDTNYIAIPSHNQVFVSDMLTKLNALAENYKIVVFSIDKLTEYENIDIKYLHKLQVHVVSPSYIDYDREEVVKFINQFNEKYKTEPGKFGFLGFDVVFYYGSALQKYGRSFFDYLPQFNMELLANSFDFIKTGFESGCENRHVYVLKYEDFKLIRVE